MEKTSNSAHSDQAEEVKQNSLLMGGNTLAETYQTQLRDKSRSLNTQAICVFKIPYTWSRLRVL